MASKISRDFLDDSFLVENSRVFMLWATIFAILFFILYNEFIPRVYIYQIFVILLFLCIMSYKIKILDTVTIVGRNKKSTFDTLKLIIKVAYERSHKHIQHLYPITMKQDLIIPSEPKRILKDKETLFFISSNLHIFEHHKKAFSNFICGLELYYILIGYISKNKKYTTIQKRNAMMNHISHLEELWDGLDMQNKQFMEKLRFTESLRFDPK